jgi:hypothetical protein
MKNILSSLNESEKKRILEMHYKASGRHYLNEAVNADYNVIKTSVDATYKETLNKYLMSSVALGGQDDNGKPTEIIFNPVNKKDTYKVTLGNMSKDVELYNPIYDCTGSSVKDYGWKNRTDSIEHYMKDYANTLGVKEPDYSMARVTLRNGLAKIGLEACKAIDAVSKGLPSPLAPKVAASNTAPKQTTPATKGTGGTVSQELLTPVPKSILTAQELQSVGLLADDGPRMDSTMTNKTDGGFIYGPGDSTFFCSSTNGRPAYTFSSTDPKLESAFAAYKSQITALWKKQCAQNAKWANAAVYRKQKVN